MPEGERSSRAGSSHDDLARQRLVQSFHQGRHVEPLSERIGGVATGWLRWKLMSDSTLAAMFVGPQCTLCSDPDWTVQQKGL